MRAILRTDINAVANNGSGGIRVTTSHPHFYTTGLNITRENIGGTTEANGTGPITVINSTQYDINNSVFANAYTSGGTCRLSCTYLYGYPGRLPDRPDARQHAANQHRKDSLPRERHLAHTHHQVQQQEANPRVNIPYIQKSGRDDRLRRFPVSAERSSITRTAAVPVIRTTS